MIELQVANQRFSGWTSAEVRRSAEAVAASFTLTVTHNDAELADFVAFEEGQACTVLVDGQPVIKGFIGAFEGDLTKEGATLTLSGRDATADLVDCAALPQGVRQWLNQPINTIVTDLCAPFGIPVAFRGDLGKPWPQFTLEPAEKVIDALRRLTQARGLLLIPDTLGGLTVAQPSTTLQPIALRQGHNLFKGSASYSDAERFSTITVFGQQQSTPTANGRTTNGATATVTDPSVKRYRPLAIQAQGQASTADCQRQAAWAMASRNGKAKRVRITLPFWRQSPNGALWDINQLVQVEAAGPPLFTNEPLIITEVTYSIDRTNGQMVELGLVRPAALLPEPEPPPPPPKAVTTASKANAPRKAKAKPNGAPARQGVGLYKVVGGQLVKVSD